MPWPLRLPPRQWAIWAMAMAFCPWIPPASAADETSRFVSHEAVYEVTVSEKTDLPVQAAGQVDLRMERTCKGWRVAHRLEVALAMAGQPPVQIISQIAFEETAGSTRLDFTTGLEVNKTVIETLKGNARIPGGGKPGQAYFEEPEGNLMDLPPETMLPIKAFARSVDRMLAGERVVEQLVFDGSDATGPVRVSDLLLADAPPLTHTPKGDADLVKGRLLRVLSSYIEPGTTDSEPRAVQRADTAPNGVTARWSFTMESVGLDATISEIRALPEPAC